VFDGYLQASPGADTDIRCCEEACPVEAMGGTT
jgi:hypothetical protein